MYICEQNGCIEDLNELPPAQRPIFLTSSYGCIYP
jgi:hypothetical protein